MWRVLVIFGVAILMSSVLGQNCFYNQKFGVNPTPLIMPNEPYQQYKGGDSCVWMARADLGYALQLTCNVIVAGGLMPVCPVDYFAVSLTGKADVSDGIKFCGKQTISQRSQAGRMTMKLFSSQDSPGGTINCSIQAVPDTCNCGRRNRPARIVEGHQTLANELPMVAALVPRGETQPFCGAVLISQFRALTVRRCVFNRTIDSFDIVVGEHDVSTASESAYTRRYTIAEYTCVNGCDGDKYWDDIAMIRTTSEVLLNVGVGVTCLPWKEYNKDQDALSGQRVEITGWGFTQLTASDLTFRTTSATEVDYSSPVLQDVFVDVIESQDCMKFYSNLPTDKMCTLTPHRGSCRGDSGGSVFWTPPDIERLYTVAMVDNAWIMDCATGWPGLNTRIVTNLHWILVNAPESNFCIV